ncbi:MAG: helix-turn-helix domain-containing protein, partial [Candidatus Poseidoniaceae archaeon]
VGFEVPSSTPEMVSRLVQETEKSTGPLPLISLDYANVDGKKLSEVLSTLVAPFERMNALVVVVLSTEQRAQWPTNLVSRFDHVDIIGSLEREEVRQLCESRMATTANISWTMSEDSLDYVMENTSGNPSRVMRLMRDLVDEERANPRDVKFDPVVENSTPSVKIQDSSIGSIDETLGEEVSFEPEMPVFDLNLDKLEEEPETIYIEDSGTSSMPVSGPFSGLAARNRDNKNLAPRFDKTKANEPNAVLATQSVQVVDEPIVDDQVDDYFESNEEFGQEVLRGGNVEGLLGQLFEALNVPDGHSLAELLAGMRRPVIGQRESNALDVHTLRNLSKNEAVLVEVSSSRELSPSDSRLQDRLKIGRPRMSQMCNRLYRAGILSVQQRGRSRMFKLTNDARAQMVAWGIMEASI